MASVVAVGTNTRIRVLKGALALTGHRGRFNARGQPVRQAAGLTRTTNRAVGAPSRDGRRRSPAAAPEHPGGVGQPGRPRQRLLRDAEGARHRPSREGAAAGWPDVRVKHVAQRGGRPRASSRPRWPDDAKALSKNHARSLSQPPGSLIQAGNLHRRMLPAGTPCAARRGVGLFAVRY